jgi:hypothetical protein
MPGVVRGPRRVGLARPLPLRLAARARTLAAVSPEDHLDLPALPASGAHDSALPDRAAPPRDLEFANNLSQQKAGIHSLNGTRESFSTGNLQARFLVTIEISASG